MQEIKRDNAAETNLIHIYRSIKAYDHKVFKYHGMVKESELGFWVDYLVSHGVTDNDPEPEIVTFDGERPGNADRITFDSAYAELPHPSLDGYRDSGILYVAPEQF